MPAMNLRIYRSCAFIWRHPTSSCGFPHVLAVFVDVLLMLDQLVLELLLEVDAFAAGLRSGRWCPSRGGSGPDRSAPSCRRRGDGALFLVAADVDVVVVRAR